MKKIFKFSGKLKSKANFLQFSKYVFCSKDSNNHSSNSSSKLQKFSSNPEETAKFSSLINNEMRAQLDSYTEAEKNELRLKQSIPDSVVGLDHLFRNLPKEEMNKYTDYETTVRSLKLLDNQLRLNQYKRELDTENPEYKFVRENSSLKMDSDKSNAYEIPLDLRTNFHSEDFNKKQPRVSNTYNYNFEDHKIYTESLKHLRKEDMLKELEEKKLLKYIKQNPNRKDVKMYIKKYISVPLEKIPDNDADISNYTLHGRKKSKLYNKPRHDTDISSYTAWRSWDRDTDFLGSKNDQQFTTVFIAPSLLIKAFGDPPPALDETMTGPFVFEDSNLDMFLVVDYKQTNSFKGLNFPDYVYKEAEEEIIPRFRELKRPSMDEFWNSEERTGFRLYYSQYAEFRKFKKWLYKEIIERKSGMSKNEELDLKYGKPSSKNDFNHPHTNFTKDDMVAFTFTPEYYLDEGESNIIPRVPLDTKKFIPVVQGELYRYQAHERYLEVLENKKRREEKRSKQREND